MPDELVCTLPWRAFNVEHNLGIVSPCCLDRTRVAYGSIHEASIQDLWNSECAQYVRRMIRAGKIDEVCRPDCPALIYGWERESLLAPVYGSGPFVENQRQVLRAIKERSAVVTAYPVRMKLLPTYLCNYTCRMCNQNHTLDNLLPETFLQELETYLPFLEEMHLLGGEVFMSSVGRSLLYCLSRESFPNLHVGLITNGSCLSDRILARLRHHAFSYVMVSIHAATRATYEHITGQDLWDCVLANVDRLIEFRNHAQPFFPVVISFTVMMSNYRELPAHLERWAGCPVERLVIPIEGDRLGESIFETPERMRAVLSVAERLLDAETTRDPPGVHGLWRLVHVLRTRLAKGNDH
jgi:pyruvate-formate lyase-activating enzyme